MCQEIIAMASADEVSQKAKDLRLPSTPISLRIDVQNF